MDVIPSFSKPSSLQLQVFSANYLSKKNGRTLHRCSSFKKHDVNKLVSDRSVDLRQNCKDFLRSFVRTDSRFVFNYSFFSIKPELISSIRILALNLQKAVSYSERTEVVVPALVLRFLVGVMLITAFSATLTRSPSWALTEENLLFLEAWRTIDRAYIDKSFNGQSWFRYRENALRTEPMSTREETYTAIKKMVATLDDPFTRFLEPQKFKSLRSGTRNTLTGVGVSIGYLTANDKYSGLAVISATPGGPANKAGISSGDIILTIDGTDTNGMEIYDAAELLQGTEGSTVELSIKHGQEIRQLPVIRERVVLNPVKSRICKSSSLEGNPPLIGYIKLTSFNQNASGAVREAIETLRERNVEAFVLDLRDNSGGLFPEGIEIAKIWLDKGVIVYICDSQGIRDVYDTDGSNVAAPSEPLAVLVNKGTASASEILAGALKDNKRAVLFGEPTYGKGKIQSVFQLSDGSGLVITVARYETPAHTDINKIGIIPDHALRFPFLKMKMVFVVVLKILHRLATSTKLASSPNDFHLSLPNFLNSFY